MSITLVIRDFLPQPFSHFSEQVNRSPLSERFSLLVNRSLATASIPGYLKQRQNGVILMYRCCDQAAGKLRNSRVVGEDVWLTDISSCWLCVFGYGDWQESWLLFREQPFLLMEIGPSMRGPHIKTKQTNL